MQRMRLILPSVLQEFCVWHTCFLGSGNLYQRQVQRRKYQEMTIFGISLGMMSCFVSIGTVIFQTAVNRLGTKIVTAHIAARRIEELTNVPMLCTGMAMTTYASQNLGAGEYDRIKKGIHQAFVIVLVQGVIFTTFCWIFGHPLIRWITSSNDTYILDTAYRYLTRNTSFYFVPWTTVCIALFSSGAGT